VTREEIEKPTMFGEGVVTCLERKWRIDSTLIEEWEKSTKRFFTMSNERRVEREGPLDKRTDSCLHC